MAFALPVMSENPGWGPPKTDDGLSFDIPYQHFFKGDRISKIADWISDNRGRGRGGRSRYWNGEGVDEEEKNWTTADYTKNTRNMRPWYRGGKGRGRGNNMQNRGGPRRTGGRGQGAVGKPKKKELRDMGFNRARRDLNLKASTEVKQSWVMKTAINISDLSKCLTIPDHPTPLPTDLACQGEALFYNDKLEKMAAAKSPLPIVEQNRAMEEGPLINAEATRTFLRDKQKMDGKIKVVASDKALATLMAAPKATIAWDIRIERVGDIYFIDWDPESDGKKWTVNETSTEPPPLEATDENKLNSQPHLMNELSKMSMNFSQQVLDRKKGTVKGKNYVQAPVPEHLEGKDQPASLVYKWRTWKIKTAFPKDPDTHISLISRTHVDGFVTNAKSFRAFTTLDPTGNTYKTLPNQEGAITAAEIKNNCCRLVKQVAVSMLAGADHMKLGFCTRKKASDNTSHQIVHIASHEPKVFAKSINLTQRGFWNVLIKILQELFTCKSTETKQRFVLMKDPTKPQLKIYDTTGDVSDDESSEDDEDEESESDSDSDSDSSSSSD